MIAVALDDILEVRALAFQDIDVRVNRAVLESKKMSVYLIQEMIMLEEIAAGVVDEPEQGAQAPPTEEGLSRRTLLLMAATGLAAAALTFTVMSFLPASAPSDTSPVFPIPAPRGTRYIVFLRSAAASCTLSLFQNIRPKTAANRLP